MIHSEIQPKKRKRKRKFPMILRNVIKVPSFNRTHITSQIKGSSSSMVTIDFFFSIFFIQANAFVAKKLNGEIRDRIHFSSLRINCDYT